jgi:hypothetical protein
VGVANVPVDPEGFKQWMEMDSETTRFLGKGGTGKLTPKVMLLFCKQFAMKSLHVSALVMRSADVSGTLLI